MFSYDFFALSHHLSKPLINFKDCVHVVDILDLCIISRKCLITELKFVEATVPEKVECPSYL